MGGILEISDTRWKAKSPQSCGLAGFEVGRKSANTKSSGNFSKKEYARLARELYKKEIKKEQLINKLEIIKQEISQIQEKLDIMNDSN